jgi:hypothetical protein
MSQASPGEGIVQRGKYWGSRGHNDSVWGKRGRQGPPIATYIYYLIILGGRILWIMTIRGFLIRIDSWCIVGVGGDTEYLVSPRVIFEFVITSGMAPCFWGFFSGCSPGSFRIKRGRV